MQNQLQVIILELQPEEGNAWYIGYKVIPSTNGLAVVVVPIVNDDELITHTITVEEGGFGCLDAASCILEGYSKYKTKLSDEGQARLQPMLDSLTFQRVALHLGNAYPLLAA